MVGLFVHRIRIALAAALRLAGVKASLRGPAGLLAYLAAVALLAAIALLAIGGPQALAAPPKPPDAPFAAAVLPFQDRRNPDKPSWLARYLSERIGKALLRAPQVAVLDAEPAAYWALRLQLAPDAAPTEAQLREMGVDVLVRGSVHEVLGLAEVQLSAESAQGNLLAGDTPLRVDLREGDPGATLRTVLERLQAGLLPGHALAESHAPDEWESVEALYRLLGTVIVPGDRAVRPGLIARLQPWETHPALGPRAREALAGLMLEQAQLYLPEGPARRLMLEQALRHAGAALRADPRDTRVQALKAELHYFLAQYHEARTEASIARIRNPLDSLAFVVLGLVAGLSTGEATEHLRRALAMDPFLRAEERPPGDPPFQGDLLAPSLRKWDELRQSGGLARRDDYAQLLADGIEQFERQEWEEAEALLRKATEREDNDYTPWLYLNRILIELGQPAAAIPGLRRLAAGNPQEPEVLHFLGVALAAGGEHTEALEAFRKALAERPQARTHVAAADSREALGQWPEAMAAVRAALQVDPDYGEAWLRMGALHARNKDWPAAEAALVRATELLPDSREAQEELAAVRKLALGS